MKVDKNAVTVFNGRQVTTSESAKFRYYRRYAVVTDLNIVFNYRTNVIEASRSDHELIDLFRGPKEKRFLEIHSANYDEKGQDRYISLYRRACRPVT